MINVHSFYPWFGLDKLGAVIVLGIGLFSALAFLYSFRFMKGKPHLPQYYIYMALTAMASLGVVASNNLILLLVFWGFLGLTLFLLINFAGSGSAQAAKKTLMIVGSSDIFMILGIGIVYFLTGNLFMDGVRLELNNPSAVFAYLCFAVACFARAGAMPFHSWIPDCAEKAPIPVTAYLPASLDKLLGIYLLVRLSQYMFVMSEGMYMFLMFVGALSIIAAVMMALIQHNMKRLLGYHAVSQVGYMILGIGTGNMIGLAGALFHMLNNAVYKSCLFFTAGNVEYRTKTSELDELGGLSKSMPVSYASHLIASLSISGVPGFNGFVSKWLIYQGLILSISKAATTGHALFIALCLLAALFGSALTIASFMKLIYAVFLGQRLNTARNNEISEVPFSMQLPCLILAGICVLFGAFAFVFPLKYLVFPIVLSSSYPPSLNISFPGLWSPGPAAFLVLAGLGLGLAVFKFGRFAKSFRQDSAFSGGEIKEQEESTMVTGVEFYNTVKDLGLLGRIYKKAQQGYFDIYEQGKKIFFISTGLRTLHNGVLPTYLVWMLLGMIGLFLVVVR